MSATERVFGFRNLALQGGVVHSTHPIKHYVVRLTGKSDYIDQKKENLSIKEFSSHKKKILKLKKKNSSRTIKFTEEKIYHIIQINRKVFLEDRGYSLLQFFQECIEDWNKHNWK